MRPDPTTPGTQPKPTALTAAVTTVAVGSPVAALTVWLLETLITVHGSPLKLDSISATLIGSAGAGVAGYLFRVFQALLHKWGIDPGEGP